MKFYIFILALALSIQSNGQNCTHNYDYSNSTGWTRVDVFPTTGNPNTGTPRVNIASGSVNFNNAPDGNNDIRVFRSLTGGALCDSWVAEFDFNISAAGSGFDNITIGHLLLALTENNQNAWENFQGTRTDNDAIMVIVSDGNAAGSTDMAIRVGMKDENNVPTVQCISPFIQLNTNYHIVLERIDGSNGRITLTNTDTETEIYNCCFTVPSSIGDLSFIQHSNGPQGDIDRTMTGSIDNTCIRDCFKVQDCCQDTEINGPSVICNTEALGVLPVYSVSNNPGTTYNWSVTGGATFNGQGTNSITLTNSHNLSGTIVITLEMTCGCVTTTLTKTVIIYDDLSAETPFTYSVTNNPSTNDISAMANTTTAGITHYWQVYEAADCLNSNKLILNENNNPLGLASAGSGTSFNVTGLDNTKCYIIQHLISFNGACEAEFRAKVYASGADSEGSTAEYYTGEVREERSSKRSNSLGSGNDAEVSVFPNPTNGQFNIHVKEEQSFSYSVFDASGKLILKGINESSELSLNLAHCESEIYKLQIQGKSGKSYSLKISKIE